MLACAQLAGLKSIVTSRLFEERARLDLSPFQKAGIQILRLEDVRKQISGPAKLAALLVQAFNPAQSSESQALRPESSSSPVVRKARQRESN